MRCEGIIGTIRPRVKADYQLALEAGKTILCILIPKQDEPYTITITALTFETAEVPALPPRRR